MAAPTPKPPVVPKPAKGPLSNAQLLKLAKRRKPPQAWYDETGNPFKAKR